MTRPLLKTLGCYPKPLVSWLSSGYCYQSFFGKVTRVVGLPSRPTFRIRATQSACLSPFALGYSSTKSVSPCNATPVGDQGRSAFRTFSTLPSVVILTTQRQPV